MTTLIISGNVNRFTFTNSIIAANHKSMDLFHQPLRDIFIVHSRESYARLHEQYDWLDHLESHGIDRETLAHRVIEIESTAESLQRFVSYAENVIRGTGDTGKLIVDLTNGTTLHKTFLSITSYVLDLSHLYMIDIIELSKLTPERGFISPDILAAAYRPAPESVQLDRIAYLNLAEVVRYKRIVDQHTERYSNISPNSADNEFFRTNLLHSVELKLSGDRKDHLDKAVYRIASTAVAASLEDLIRVMLERYGTTDSTEGTFGQNLQKLAKRVRVSAPADFDYDFLNRFNDFMLYLRNSTTHKGRLLTEVEKFKAELSVKMAFPFIQFYTDIVHNVLNTDSDVLPPKKIRRFRPDEPTGGAELYFGLDGDNTGTILEELFCSSSDERRFRQLSRTITDAIHAIADDVIKAAGKESIVFEAGDDLLFKGRFSRKTLVEYQRKYAEMTNLSCSIGYGRTFQEVYLALKYAKTEPGKGGIVGIEIV